jgi:hypothetical protein
MHNVFIRVRARLSLFYVLLLVHSLTVRSSLQMALSQKFQYAVLGTAVRISRLDIDKRYPFLQAERPETK